MSFPVHITASDRIPRLQKVMFSAGSGVDAIGTGLLTGAFWMTYFNIGLGLSPVLLSLVLGILQVWNAMVDPIMGNLSDNARTRWGRRRPFMFVGAILTGIMFIAVWHVPLGNSDLQNGITLTLAGMIFFLCFSCWSMPYYSLQLELTPNYDERTRVSAWIALSWKITGLITGWAMVLVTCKWFANPSTGVPDVVNGIRSTSWFFGALLIILGLLPAFFVKERYYEKEASKQAKDPFWQSIRESAHCRPLWLLIGISFFLIMGSTSVGVLGSYVNLYYVNHGHIETASWVSGWRSTVVLVTGILLLPVWTWMGEKFDKRTIVGAMIVFSMFGHSLNFFCMQPGLPYLQIIPGVFESAAISAAWLFLPSMKADVSDYDEMETSRRREGSLNSFYSWFIKAAHACSIGFGGLLLQSTGFNVKIHGQSDAVLMRMFWLYLLIPLAIWCVALAFVYFFPLNRQGMAGIRLQLETRRGKN